MSDRPRPPEDIEGEALLEFHRVCDELSDLGRLEKADRAMLTLYAYTWAMWWEAEQKVVKKGAVVKLPNGILTTNPYYDIAKEKAKLLTRLLNDMGLTHRTKPRTKDPSTEDLEV